MTSRRVRTRMLITMTGLYPRWWRQRYRDEFTEMIRTLLAAGRRPNTPSLLLDIVVGALDAHMYGAAPVRGGIVSVSRRAARVGLVVAALIAVDNFLANVVFPSGSGDGSVGDEVDIVVVYVGIIAVLMVLGSRVRRSVRTWYAPGAAGAIAGFVIGTVTVLSWVVVGKLPASSLAIVPMYAAVGGMLAQLGAVVAGTPESTSD